MPKNPSAKRIKPILTPVKSPGKAPESRYICFTCRKKRIASKMTIVFSHGIVGIVPIRACIFDCALAAARKIIAANREESLLQLQVKYNV